MVTFPYFTYYQCLLLDGGWTINSPVDVNKSLSLPKIICSQEVVSSCLVKDLSAWRRSPSSIHMSALYEELGKSGKKW